MRTASALLAGICLLIAGGCGSSGSGSSAPGTTKAATATTATSTSAGPATTLQVLVTNDDGYDAAGIDTIVEALRKLPDTKVTVIAPAANRSGTGGRTTGGTLTVSTRKTLSGYPATAVQGYPADTIAFALGGAMALEPDVVVSGVNIGANLGPLTAISGTVGAAKAAAAAGIPALALSAGVGVGDPTDFATTAKYGIDWITAHRQALLSKPTGAVTVVAINAPTCTTGKVRGAIAVPLAATLDGVDITKPDCTSTATQPANDAAAFMDGYAAVTTIDPAGTTVTATTAWPAN